MKQEIVFRGFESQKKISHNRSRRIGVISLAQTQCASKGLNKTGKQLRLRNQKKNEQPELLMEKINSSRPHPGPSHCI